MCSCLASLWQALCVVWVQRFLYLSFFFDWTERNLPSQATAVASLGMPVSITGWDWGSMSSCGAWTSSVGEASLAPFQRKICMVCSVWDRPSLLLRP